MKVTSKALMWVALGCFVLGAIAGAGVVVASGPSSTAKPQVVEGYVTAVNVHGTAIGLSPTPGASGEGYVIAGAKWRHSGQAWSSAFPTCLAPLTGGQHVRLGVIDVHPSAEAGGGPVVAWLECLD